MMKYWKIKANGNIYNGLKKYEILTAVFVYMREGKRRVGHDK